MKRYTCLNTKQSLEKPKIEHINIYVKVLKGRQKRQKKDG